MSRKFSKKCVELVQKFEGLYLRSYRDSTGKWTIGWGTTSDGGTGFKVRSGQEITRDKAEELLILELEYKAAIMDRMVRVPLTQNQYDGLLSFVYNIGTTKFKNSTLLKKLNRGDYNGAGSQMLRWVKAKKAETGLQVELRGLVRRRKAESELFLHGIHAIPTTQEKNAATMKRSETIPTTHSNPVSAAVATSTTVKQAAAGAAFTIGSVIQLAGENPLIAVIAVGAVVALFAVIYTKIRDIKEFA